MIEKALTGSKTYRGWLMLLLSLVAAGAIAYAYQLREGLGITGMSRDVSWGLYIANFTFLVGIAASAVVLVLPYYLHNYKEFARLTILGEFLAVAALVAAISFVVVDLGQPGRLFNLIIHPSPSSLLFWDVIVLGVYLLLNLVTGWAVLDAEHKEEAPARWVKPLILLSIPWAVGIHTITAFIYSGLSARAYWLTALMAPRFLVSAFASGPALLIVIALAMNKLAGFEIGREPLQKVARIMTYAMVINIFFWLVEFFTVFYSGVPEHIEPFRYLLFGLDGQARLVPLTWTSIGLSVLALALLMYPGTRRKEGFLAAACLAVFSSIWLEKGLGLIVPGFIPSPTGQITEYWPTIPEALIMLGIWALGLLLVTVFYKVVVSVRKQASA